MKTMMKWGENVERLVTVKGMRERYGCSNPTARKYLRQCVPHMEKPLAAPEWAVREWEENRTVIAPELLNHKRDEIVQRMKNDDRVIVPRRR